MKKIYTILFSMAVLASSAFAQTNNKDWNDRNNSNNNNYHSNDNYHDATNNNVYQNDRNDHRFNPVFNIQRRDMLVQKINNDFNFRIDRVKYDRSLNRRQRKHMIEDLQAQRDQQISEVYRQFAYNDHIRR